MPRSLSFRRFRRRIWALSFVAMSNTLFAYHGDIIDRFPTIRAGVVHASNLTNGASPTALIDEYRAEQRAVAAKLDSVSLAELSSVAAWRRAFSQFGVKPTQYRNASEALLRRLTKHGDIPSINVLVDIGNLVSIRYAMPVAAVDRDGIAGGITVQFATGEEIFTDLGSTELVHPEPGEVVFVDATETVCARRWCWRQSAQSATTASTREALVVIEGHHPSAGEEIESAVADLNRLLVEYQPLSQMRSYMLSPTDPHAVETHGARVDGSDVGQHL